MSDIITPQSIVSDEEIERVHGTANFGEMSKRRVVDEGVLKYAFGYTGGRTQLSILLEHGLVRKPRLGRSETTLTKKGLLYLRSLFGDVSSARMLNAFEDTKRLSFLDSMNAALNAKYGTTYRWKLILNHNVNRLMVGHLEIDLHDSAPHGAPSCRQAIDEAMHDIEARRAARGEDKS